MAAKEKWEQMQLFEELPRGKAKNPGDEISPGISKPQMDTHQASLTILSRRGTPIIESTQLCDNMKVTFIHPETGRLLAGKIFEESDDSQPWETKAGLVRFYLNYDPKEDTSEGWGRGKIVLGENIGSLSIYKE